MARWRQCSKTGKLIPIDESARKRDGHAIHGDIEPFVSPIDGTVISDRKQYNEHCKRHNVVPSAEFTPEFYAEKAKERARVYTGEHTRADSFKRKQEIHEIINRMERNGR